MKIEETYNIHKKINCIFPFFKSKLLCKKDCHNYILNPKIVFQREETKISEHGLTFIFKTKSKVDLKCLCCGKEEELEDSNENKN